MKKESISLIDGLVYISAHFDNFSISAHNDVIAISISKKATKKQSKYLEALGWENLSAKPKSITRGQKIINSMHWSEPEFVWFFETWWT